MLTNSAVDLLLPPFATGAMDSSAATAALAAVAAAGMFEGTAVFLSACDPVPHYHDP